MNSFTIYRYVQSSRETSTPPSNTTNVNYTISVFIKVNVDQWGDYLKLYGAFHQDAYFNQFHLPNAVMLEKIRSITRALYYTHSYFKSKDYTNQTNKPLTKSISVFKLEQPPSILAIIGKPNIFGMIKLYNQILQNEKYTRATEYSIMNSKVVLQDSLVAVKESHEAMFNNPLYIDTFPEDVDVLQVSSRDISYSAPHPNIDVVYSDVPKVIAQNRKNATRIPGKKDFKYID